ncbi:hypothetical protein LCGC14_1681000 [marine sediment metagenome]|uniref:HNH nuclease domain-containing protein n=1 Tax=marine sediment metagenome TaxID=412755 RepID=A0A0F9HNN3_9ZZZZ
MAKLGEIKTGRELGRTAISAKFIWAACEDCSKERWTIYRPTKEWFAPRCLPCSGRHNGSTIKRETGSKSPSWKGGKFTCPEGYVYAYVALDSIFAPMRRKGHHQHTLEHRLVVAKHLGRCLTDKEVVHHLNGIKDDNRLENLQLTTKKNHHSVAFFLMRKEIATLREEVIALKKQSKEQFIRVRRLELIRNHVKINSA